MLTAKEFYPHGLNPGAKEFIPAEQQNTRLQPEDQRPRAETTSPRCLNVNVVDFQPRGLSPEASEFIPAAQRLEYEWRVR